MKALLGILVLVLSMRANAIVWQEGCAPEKEQKGEMMNVGKVFYSPLKVFGASCVALGDEWVMTCRHGTEKWVAGMLKVSFPALGDEVYEVEKVHFPKSGDLALLELKKKVRLAKKLDLTDGLDLKGKRVWLGGFGMSGSAKRVGFGGNFASGYNRIDSAEEGKWVISMSKKGKGEDLEVVIATLDSGSPMFVEEGKGWRLCGIASTATNRNNPGTGDRGNYAMVGAVKEWLGKLME
jgi:hypothetical protein